MMNDNSHELSTGQVRETEVRRALHMGGDTQIFSAVYILSFISAVVTNAALTVISLGPYRKCDCLGQRGCPGSWIQWRLRGITYGRKSPSYHHHFPSQLGKCQMDLY